MFRRTIALLIGVFLVWGFTGCENANNENNSSVSTSDNESTSGTVAKNPEGTKDIAESSQEDRQTSELPKLSLIFGYEGQGFIINLEDNETAMEIARDVGAAEWNLPIFNFDNFENYEVMQYYDIPSHYDYTSNPETVTSEKAGEVYYSDPNRIILFYNDAEVTGEYTKIGTINATDEFIKALEENPVLDGWNCKIITITRTD